MSKQVVAVVVAAAVSVGMACASSPQPEQEDHQPEEPADRALEREPPESAGPDILEVYEAGARWLPGDANAVAVGGWEPLWEQLDGSLFPTALPDAEPGEAGTLEGLQRGLEEVLEEEFGFDPTPTDSFVVGGSLYGREAVVMGVIFGEFDEPTDLFGVDVADTTIYELDFADIGVPVDPRTYRVYGTLIDEPRDGIVVTGDSRLLERIVEMRHAGQEVESLATTSTGEEYTQLFEEVEHATVAAAGTLEPLRDGGLIDAEAPIPETAVSGVSSRGLQARFEGRTEVLEYIDDEIQERLTEAQRYAEQEYEDTEPGTFERANAIYYRHLMESVVQQGQPEFGDDQLEYDVYMADSPYRGYFFLGVGAALSVPAFVTYQHRAQASEADALVGTMVDAGLRYYRDEQQYSTPEGAEPWHVPGDDAEPGETVPDDEKVFPGGPDIEIVSSPEVPERGETVQFDPQLVEGDVDFDPEVVFGQLNMQVGADTHFRYVYETGPGTGEEATAFIRAEANFNPDSEEHHTVVQELEIGPDGRATATPMWIENELE